MVGLTSIADLKYLGYGRVCGIVVGMKELVKIELFTSKHVYSLFKSEL
jgi:hypothetical protein